jgi:hypothetical protein
MHVGQASHGRLGCDGHGKWMKEKEFSASPIGKAMP